MKKGESGTGNEEALFGGVEDSIEEELAELEVKYDEVHRIRDEINRLQDALQLKRREAENFSNRIYGLKTFKVKKPRKR